MRKFFALAALCGMALAAGTPALASTTVTSGGVTVKWAVAPWATIVANQNYSAAGAGTTGAITGYLQANGGTGACSFPASAVAATVDFGTITSDTGANDTDCLYKNALNIQIQTNSTSWTLTETLGANTTNNYRVCAYPNSGAWPVTVSTTPLAVAQSARVAAVATTTTDACTAAALSLGVANSAMASGSVIETGANFANIGEDLEVVAPALGGTAETFTLTATIIAS